MDLDTVRNKISSMAKQELELMSRGRLAAEQTPLQAPSLSFPTFQSHCDILIHREILEQRRLANAEFLRILQEYGNEFLAASPPQRHARPASHPSDLHQLSQASYRASSQNLAILPTRLSNCYIRPLSQAQCRKQVPRSHSPLRQSRVPKGNIEMLLSCQTSLPGSVIVQSPQGYASTMA